MEKFGRERGELTGPKRSEREPTEGGAALDELRRYSKLVEVLGLAAIGS